MRGAYPSATDGVLWRNGKAFTQGEGGFRGAKRGVVLVRLVLGDLVVLTCGGKVADVRAIRGFWLVGRWWEASGGKSVG